MLAATRILARHRCAYNAGIEEASRQKLWQVDTRVAFSVDVASVRALACQLTKTM